MNYDAWKTREPEHLDPGRLRSDEDREDAPGYEWCDKCGGDIRHGAISLQGLGLFCSRTCATAASQEHAAVLSARMFGR